MIPSPHTILVALVLKALVPAILGLFGLGANGDGSTLESLTEALPLGAGAIWEGRSLAPITTEPVRVHEAGRERIGVGHRAVEAWRLQVLSDGECRLLWVGVVPPHPLVRLDPPDPEGCDLPSRPVRR